MNPAEDFPSHLRQVGVYDQERVIQVPQCSLLILSPGVLGDIAFLSSSRLRNAAVP